MATQSEQEIDAYVRRLLWALQALPHDDRLNIASEIHGHLSERAGRGPSELERAMAGMGSPDALARSYVEEFELAGAINRASPVTLLLSVLNRAGRSGLAFFGSFAAVLLYLVSGAFALMAVMKLVEPDKVGAWQLGHGGFAFAILDRPPPTQTELLGYWIVPLSVMLATLCFLGGSKLLRLAGRRLLARQRAPRAA
ncbi:HAAS signaling domain-containing protein [Sphingomonas crusticola]|uniref:HAAS signaling domain-containing protein n=1 Tax=Sphingomonas crusticola TaxID=1697973 RepID=UPI000E24BFBD|nr:hypothetical protein [Sphingomonas crusticola]